MNADGFSAKIPLIFGAAGHRDISPEGRAEIEACVKRELASYQRKFPHTPLIVLSQLAPGADRLIASWATQADAPCQLCIVEVENSGVAVEKPDAELAELRQRAQAEIVLRASDGATLRHGGAFIARQSQILLVLWDGQETSESHTAQVIRWQRDGAPESDGASAGMLDTVECGPVCHIVTCRSNATPPPHAGKARWIFPGDSSTEPEQAAVAWDSFVGQVNEFNADLVRHSARPTYQSKVDQGAEYLFPADKAVNLSKPLQATRLQYAAADTLAQHFQKKVKSTHWLLLGLIFLAGVSFATYAHLFMENLWLLALYFLAVLGGWGLTRRVARREYHRKWLDYRALAEAMRVEFFWKLAGLPQTAADHYLRNLRSEVDWIRAAIRAWEISSGHHSSDVPQSKDHSERIRWCRDYWLSDQEKFFHKKAPANKTLHAKAENRTRWAFHFGIGFSVALLIYQLVTHHPSHPLIVAMVVSSLVAALLHHAETTAGHAMLARSYEWMHGLYSLARKQLDALMANPATAPSQTHSLLKELGREALAENGHWLLYHRERPPRLPHVE